MIVVTWFLLTSSALLWTAICFRLRFLENRFPPLDATTPLPAPRDGWPPVSIIIPARNEARDLAATLGALQCQEYPDFEIIVVDDRSTDATARIAEEAGRGLVAFRLIRGAPRPDDGWAGKNWALVQGTEAARYEWLLFLDADVVLHPAALKQAMAGATLQNVDALSVLPAIECRTVWEKTIMPLFALLSALVEPMDRANHPEKAGSRLSGAFILVRRSAYEAAGGHRAVAGRIIEDMALAKNFKRGGYPIRLLWTHDLLSTRMYDTFRDLWSGLIRLSYPMMEYSPPRLLLAWAAALIGAWTPWFVLVAGAWQTARGQAAGIASWLVALVLCMAIPRILRKVLELLRVKRLYAWLLPAAALLYCLAATWSALRYTTGRGIAWKQRLYHRS
ncbi:MAG: glycosyltransferase family 2 protein [Verrucomicrobia bacterium]|nr:glycosyltransferase family 2 protein [Verrucomicrobiota bacterium]MBU1908724.1 glycosyltransferase family 2 protein [Verrucomicrobiota bacterium]